MWVSGCVLVVAICWSLLVSGVWFSDVLVLLFYVLLLGVVLGFVFLI